MIDDKIQLLHPAGHIKLETFDALTGRKCAETEGHNLFTNYGLERFRRYQVLGLTGYMGCGNWLAENDSSGEEIYSNENNPSWGFLKYLITTDNSAAITAADCIIPGTCVGWAARGGSATTDTKCGAVNIAESYCGRNGMKMVYDFPTDKGNGTHDSVFWSDKAVGSYNYYWPYAYIDTAKQFARAYTCFVESNDGYFYGTSGSTLYKIDPDTYAEVATYTLQSSPSTWLFEVYDGICYFTVSYSVSSIYVYNTLTSTGSTISLGKTVYYAGGGAVISGYLYFCNYGQTLYKLKLSTNVLTAVRDWTPNLNYGHTRRVGSNLYFIVMNTADGIYSVDPSTGNYTAIANTYFPTTLYPGASHTVSDALWIPRTITSYGSSQKNTYTPWKWSFTKTYANMITAKVLDAPITKLNTQTMKISYTITWS